VSTGRRHGEPSQRDGFWPRGASIGRERNQPTRYENPEVWAASTCSQATMSGSKAVGPVARAFAADGLRWCTARGQTMEVRMPAWCISTCCSMVCPRPALWSRDGQRPMTESGSSDDPSRRVACWRSLIPGGVYELQDPHDTLRSAAGAVVCSWSNSQGGRSARRLPLQAGGRVLPPTRTVVRL
jgi:hypothetical protein